MDALWLTQALIPQYLMFMARPAGLFLTMPFFGDRTVPPLVRVGLSLLVGLILGPQVPELVPGTPWLVALMGELLMGALFGLLVALFFAAMQMAGSILDFEFTFSLSESFLPGSQISSTPMARWFHLMVLLIFFRVEGHHAVLRALAESYHSSPPGAIVNGAISALFFLEMAQTMWETALTVALPMMAALLLANLFIALMARLAPSLNMLLLGPGLKVLVGLGALALLFPLYLNLVEQSATWLFAMLESASRGLH